MAEHKFIHIELSAQDRNALGKFYTDLFGWKVAQIDDMNYATFDEGLSGGLNPVSENYPAGTVVPYITTDDVDATLAKAESLGGKIVMPKMQVPTVGDLGMFTDPTGNLIGLLKGEEM